MILNWEWYNIEIISNYWIWREIVFTINRTYTNSSFNKFNRILRFKIFSREQINSFFHAIIEVTIDILDIFDMKYFYFHDKNV